MSRSAIAGSIWRPLRGIDAHRLRDARQQVHQAVKWLARAARAYLQPRADDGHTSLGWDDSLNGFVTHPMPGGMQLCLCVPSLTWGDRKDVVPLSLGGHTDGRVRQWIGEQVAKQGLDANALDAPAPYTLTLNATYDAMSAPGCRPETATTTNPISTYRPIRGRIRQRCRSCRPLVIGILMNSRPPWLPHIRF